jgi:hypothetical protein
MGLLRFMFSPYHLPAPEQDVNVTRLRQTFARLGAGRQAVALDDGHSVKMIGQDARGE